jgi:heat shock protein HtpX
MAKQAYKIQVIEHPATTQEQWLVDTIRSLAAKAKVQMPEVGIYESPEVNAFATGPSRSNSLVAVSSGLLREMEPREVEGVLAHEMTHISNGDMVTMSLLQGILNTFVVFLSRIGAFFIDQWLRKDEEDSGPGWGYLISSIIFQIILGILASMIVMAFSRQREFRADAGAAHLSGKEAMIAALRRLQSIMEADPIIDDRSASISAFKINGKPHGFFALMASHPSLEDRIEALEKLA